MARLLFSMAAWGLLAAVLQNQAGAAEDQVVSLIGKHGGVIERNENLPGKPIIEVSFSDRGDVFTDASLRELAPHLAGLPELRALLLSNTAITDQGVKELAPLRQLRVISLHSTAVTNEGVKELVALSGLRWLDLSSTRITPAGLKYLAGLPHLADLELNGPAVTDAFLREVAAFQGLQVLGLADTQITDKGLQHLAGLKQLIELELGGSTGISDAGLKALAGHQRLEALSLHRTPITDEGLREVAQLPQLVSLDLTGTAVQGPGLKHLTGLSGLRWLSLRECTLLTDAGVTHLANCKALRHLFIEHTGVSAAAADRLRQALPGCNIRYKRG